MSKSEDRVEDLKGLVKQVEEYADGRGVNFMDVLNLIMITHLQAEFPAPAGRKNE